MHSYAYFYKDETNESFEFQSKYSDKLKVENVFCDEPAVDDARPNLEALIEVIHTGDILHIDSLSSLGTSMSDVLMTLHSFYFENITLKIENENDSELFTSIGGVKAFSKVVIGIQDLQMRVAKYKRINGIKKALIEDSLLPDSDKGLRKYKGRIGKSDAEKLEVTGSVLSGESPTKTANTFSISRGSVYNFIDSMSTKYSAELESFKSMVTSSKFRVLNDFCYENIEALILDIVIFSKNNSHADVINFIYSDDFENNIKPRIYSVQPNLSRNLVSDINKISEYSFTPAQLDLAFKLTDILLDYKVDNIKELKSKLSSPVTNGLSQSLSDISTQSNEILQRMLDLLNLTGGRLEEQVSEKLRALNLVKVRSSNTLSSEQVFESLFKSLNARNWKLIYFFFGLDG